MQNGWSDVRYALRGFVRTPAFAIAAICSMAAGIGANTAVFSVFNAILLRPLPYPEPHALVAIAESDRQKGLQRFTLSPPDFLAWRANATTLRASAAWRDWTPNLTGVDRAEQLNGIRVSGDFFALLGVQPAAGRALLPADETADSRVVVISQTLARRLFGADVNAVEQTFRLDGESFTVAGVIPSSLQFPARDIDIWRPLNLDAERNDRGEHSLLVVARLKDGISPGQAGAELRGLSVRHEQESDGHIPDAVPMRDWFVGANSRAMLWVLLGAVGLLLLTACANVANLLLARGGARTRELMVRTALGATRGRLVAQLVTEALLLAGLAGGLGLLLATWSVDALVAVLPPMSSYRMMSVAIDWRVLGYAFGISIAAGLLFGALPALRYSQADVAPSRVPVHPTSFRTRSLLLIAQTALAVTLLAGAGLLAKAFLAIWQIDPGFSAADVMTARMTRPPGQPPESYAAFFQQVIEQLSTSPGVTAAAAVTHVPLSGVGNSGYITIEGRESLAASPATQPGSSRLIVTPAYFRALGIGLRDGRLFTDADAAGAPPVVIVSEALARQYWPGESPVGRRIKRGTPPAPFPWLTIVGVVRDVRQQALGAATGSMVYLPLAQSPESAMTLVVRSELSNAAMAARIGDAVRTVDRDQPVASVRALDEIVFGSVSARWLPTLWMGLFAALALVLAAFGVYGVVSYVIEQRRREFGIRMALGAGRADLIRLAVRQGVVPAWVGTALGIGAAALLARLGTTMFAGVTGFDVPTFLLAALLLSACAFIASYAPARRFVREDITLTLRAE